MERSASQMTKKDHKHISKWAEKDTVKKAKRSMGAFYETQKRRGLGTEEISLQ
jgi:hypothetical protein